MYVAIWAGGRIQETNMHPPYNLCLRLLLELTSHVLVLPPLRDMATFDATALPCNAGTGYSRKCAVKRHAANNTLVIVRSSLAWQPHLSLSSDNCHHHKTAIWLSSLRVCLLSERLSPMHQVFVRGPDRGISCAARRGIQTLGEEAAQ